MQRKFLEDLGLDKDLIDKILNEAGKDAESFKNTKTALETEKKALEAQVAEANKKIEEFSNVDISKLKDEIESYKKKYEESEKTKALELKNLNLNHEIDKAIIGAKAKNAKAVRGLLDINSLEASKDLSKDIETQLKGLLESDSYLFDSNVEEKSLGTGGSKKAPGGASEVDPFLKGLGF